MSKAIASSPRANSIAEERFLRLPQVKERTGVSRSFIYAGAKNGTFPVPRLIGARAVGWLESELTAWIEARIAARKQEAA